MQKGLNPSPCLSLVNLWACEKQESIFLAARSCCSWLHRLELLRQAQDKDGNSGH